jgi:two-component system response regulator AtoC
LELAAGGTLFLDEIGELGLAMQTKFLRALETTTFRRVGGTRDLPVDVRIIAATNRNLEQEVAAGRFRLDLFHRLDVFHLTVPPLRERREDIAQLARFLLERIAQRLARLPPPSLSPEAERVLVAYDYPGNVRELRNVLERALILEAGPQITPASLVLGRIPRAPFGDAQAAQAAQAFFAAPLLEGRPPTLAELEKAYVERLLAYTSGNRTQVARLLGVSYPTVAKKIADYGIKIPE